MLWLIYLSLVLVQPRKTPPCLTERLLMGRKESNQNLFVYRYKIVLDSDSEEYGGHKRLDHNVEFFTYNECWDDRFHSLKVRTGRKVIKLFSCSTHFNCT